jgi:hypothetical protein
MNLTPLGAHVAQQGIPERSMVGQRLLQDDNIRNYVDGGLCYDCVVYTRFLLGANIDIPSLLNITAQDWRSQFNFSSSMQWYGGPIEFGTAVGFEYVYNNDVFHAAISTGGYRVRGENGGKLGAGWIYPGDGDLAKLERVRDGIFRLPGEKMEFRVRLSNL